MSVPGQVRERVVSVTLQHSLGLTSENQTSVLSPALHPGLLGSSGGESLG